MEITVFDSDHEKVGVRYEKSWPELVALLSTPRLRKKCPTKSSLATWSPAIFAGDQRAGENVLSVGALVFDVDEAPIPDAASLRQTFGNARFLAHSSSSATIISPRWRLVLPLSEPVTAEDYAKMWKYVTKQLPFPVGAASKDASRCWYVPLEGTDGSFTVISSQD